MEVSIGFDCLDPAKSLEFYRRLFTAGGVTCRLPVADGGVASLSVLAPKLVFVFRKVDGITSRVRVFELVVRLPDPEKVLAAFGEHWHSWKEEEKIVLSDWESNRVVLIKEASASVSIVATKP